MWSFLATAGNGAVSAGAHVWLGAAQPAGNRKLLVTAGNGAVSAGAHVWFGAAQPAGNHDQGTRDDPREYALDFHEDVVARRRGV